MNDAMLRTLAVAVAAALLAAPYYRVIVEKLVEAAAAAKAHGPLLGRLAAAGLIVAAAWGKIPVPEFELPTPTVTVPTPSPEMQKLVEPVAQAIAGLPADQRALWAATWSKAALVVKAEGTSSVEVFTDTPSLRLFTTVALDVAWRRLGDARPGSVDGLREAVETALRSAMGLDSVPVTPQVRASYAKVAEAIAWAGTR